MRTGQLLVISQVCAVRGLPENDTEGEAEVQQDQVLGDSG
jgi:hypothetical protein